MEKNMILGKDILFKHLSYTEVDQGAVQEH